MWISKSKQCQWQPNAKGKEPSTCCCWHELDQTLIRWTIYHFQTQWRVLWVDHFLPHWWMCLCCWENIWVHSQSWCKKTDRKRKRGVRGIYTNYDCSIDISQSISCHVMRDRSRGYVITSGFIMKEGNTSGFWSFSCVSDRVFHHIHPCTCTAPYKEHDGRKDNKRGRAAYVMEIGQYMIWNAYNMQ